jgi:uncharacterized damage-inducible protein DinB
MPEYAAWVLPLVERDRTARAEAARLARIVQDGQLAAQTGDAGWSVRDEFAHMAGADATFAPVLQTILAGETPDLSVFANIDANNARMIALNRGRPMSDLADALDESGRVLAALFARLTDTDESRQPDGVPIPLGAMINGYTQHHAYHVGQVQAALGLGSHGDPS